MSLSTRIFFASLFALVNLLLGGQLAKVGSERNCGNVKTAYAAGQQAGLTQATQNGACVQWWTESTTADIQAARRAFCKRKLHVQKR